MNSVKIAYIFAITISEIVFLLGAVLTPILVTPGWYFWTVFFLILFVVNVLSFGQRIDSWNWDDK